MKFVPSLKCWLASILLFLAILPTFFAFGLFGRIALGFVKNFANISQDAFILALIWGIFLTFFLVPIYTLALIHRILWGKAINIKYQWIPAAASWVEGFWQWTVMFVSLFSAISILEIFDSGFELDPGPTEDYQFGMILVAFMIISAYLHHARLQLQLAKPEAKEINQN